MMARLWITWLVTIWLFTLTLLVTCQQPHIQRTYSISEELEMGAFVANIKQDANLQGKYTKEEMDMVKFRFLSTPDLDFTLDENTGFIWTAQRIDRDEVCPRAMACTFTLDIVVLIPETMRFLEIIKISLEVVDLNDNGPEFPEPLISHRVSESAMPGSSFVIPTAIDPDSGDFGIQGFELWPSDSKFDLHMKTKVDGSVELRLVLKEQLDREKEHSYDLKVIAYDGGTPPKKGSMDIHVEVQDTNDNEPKFTNATYEVTIPENFPPQSTIVKVTAHDLDTGVNGAIVYAFSTQTKGAYGHLFGIRNHTGEIYVLDVLDYEEGAIYHLSVMAHDQGPDSVPADATVIVRVEDINDNAPQITVNTLAAAGTEVAEISEDSAPDTFVAHLTVMDPDSGSNGAFTCGLKDNHFRLEQMFFGEYKIVNVAPLDRETRQTYNLAVTCKDEGSEPQLSIKHIQVTVVDINDNSPIFKEEIYSAMLLENNLVGAFVLHVNATDDDIGDNAKIRYTLNDDVRDLLYVDQRSGTVMAKVSFDHEDVQDIAFTVTATDKGEPPLSASTRVLVKIGDVNDEIPQFSQDGYSFAVYENEPEGTEVGVVNAIDLDSDPYNQFEFSLVPSHGSVNFFNIDPRSGQITTQAVLDREDTAVYRLIVSANDVEDASMSSTATVSVYVADTNDNSPSFEFPSQANNTIQMSTLAHRGYEIIPVKAVDRDISKNGNLTYEFYKGNEEGNFNIDSLTGVISVAQSLKHIDYQLFELVIVARDHGDPQMAAMTNLNIVVNRSIPFPYTQNSSLIGPNTTIVVSLTCISLVIVLILIIAIVVIRKQDKDKKNQKYVEALKVLSAKEAPKDGDGQTLNGPTLNGPIATTGSSTNTQPREAIAMTVGNGKVVIAECTEIPRNSKSPSPAGTPLNPESDKGKVQLENQKNQKMDAHKSVAAAAAAVARENHRDHPENNLYLPEQHPPHKLAVPAHACAVLSGDAKSPGPGSTGNTEQVQKPHPPFKPRSPCGRHLERHQFAAVLKHEDAESTSSGEGSNADSGRGPSEEGDGRQHHPDLLPPQHTTADGKLSPSSPHGPDVHRGHPTQHRFAHRGVVNAHPLKHNTYSPAARRVIDPRNPDHSRTLPHQPPPPPPYHKVVHGGPTKTVTIQTPTGNHVSNHNPRSMPPYSDRPGSPNYSKLQGSHRLHSANEGGYNVQSRTYFDPRNERGHTTPAVTLSDSDHDGPFISKDVMV